MISLSKTIEEIDEMYHALREGIRHNLSAKLDGYTENNPKEVYISLDFGSIGLSSLEMITITCIFQDNEGIIWMKFQGNDDYTEFDDFNTEDLLQIMKEL